MITTNDIKARQAGPFSVGPDNSQKKILILASCRGVPYLNYLNRYNEGAGRPFKITFINPSDYNWNANEVQQNLEAKLASLETDERVLKALRECDIFIHEHHENFGMFNTSMKTEKHIWAFGMRRDITEIRLPNFHNHFILANDLLVYEKPICISGPEELRDTGKISPDTEWAIKLASEFHIRRFTKHCDLSSFPSFGCWFRENWKTTRLFWTFNHIAAPFSLELFRMINCQFLHLPLDAHFWAAAAQEDLYAYPRTPYTELDQHLLGVRWNMPVEPLKLT